MTHATSPPAILEAFDDETRYLVRAAAIVTIGGEQDIRDALAEAARRVRPTWMEELLLQTYLFAGFPRGLNAMRVWRRVSGREAPSDSVITHEDRVQVDAWRRAGERTCERVYGESYRPLRRNIRALHPELDEWMIVEGYGKVLSRPALDLPRRELCIVAACAAAEQDRQLHSHLRGALNVGVASGVVDEMLDELAPFLPNDAITKARLLWARVKRK
jgi:4-carboxymuconolactone decarboxylase